MNNLSEYNEFKNKKTDGEYKPVKESAQIIDDKWVVRTRVEIPSSLINSYMKKVKDETGVDPRRKVSEQEIAEDIARYVSNEFLTIENLPVNLVSGGNTAPKTQTQVQQEMPIQTQVQGEIAQPVQDSPAQPVQNAPAQPVPVQGTPQPAPVQPAPAQNAQSAANAIPQNEI